MFTSDRARRQALSTCGMLCMITGAALLLSMMMIPLAAVDSEIEIQGPVARADRNTDKPPTLSVDDFRYIWRKKLRFPLVDPKPITKAVQAKPEPRRPPTPKSLNAKLVATLVDEQPDNSIAWIEINGKKGAYRLGDEIRFAAVTGKLREIQANQATVELSGESRVIPLDKKFAFEETMQPEVTNDED